jgi:hypothetical protein
LTEPETTPTGQPQVEPTQVMTAPAPTTAPTEVKPEPQATKYGGKSLEELAREMEDKDRYISEVNERAARAEHEAMLTRNLVEQFARDRGKQDEVPEIPSVTDDEFLTNPAKATGKIIEGYFARDRQEREKERVGQYVDRARSSYETGKAAALKANPSLYRGIEADISREVLNNVQSSLRAGQPVDAAVLENPRYWEAAALAMRVMNGEDVSKYYGKTHTPMTPAHTETPTAGAPPQDVVTMSEEERYAAKSWGITDEQYMAQKRRSNEESARLAR